MYRERFSGSGVAFHFLFQLNQEDKENVDKNSALPNLYSLEKEVQLLVVLLQSLFKFSLVL